jgi:NADPH:quinone reductase-like Zn-dependent oxidoreductase
MRAFVVTGPRRSQVTDVAGPVPAPGQVVVDVERVGVCGTDVEFFTGEMAYLQQGHAAYPMRPGHEWCGTGRPSTVDTRTMVLKDITAVGILGASAGLAGTIEQYAAGAVGPRPLVAATVGPADVGQVLAGWRPAGAGPGPKIHVDPRI